MRRLLTLDPQFALGIGVVGTNPDIRANAVAIDSAGDAYVTGSLAGSADFSAGRGAAAVLKSVGGRDLFVAKYSPAGALLWAKTLPGTGSSSVAQGSALAVDPSGNVLLTGSFGGSVRFGPGSATLTSPAGATDPFVAKLDASGTVLWVRDIRETAFDVGAGRAIASDASGNVYLTGSFAESAAFGATTLTAVGQADAFVTKLDAAGNFVWASATRGSAYPASAVGNGIAVDASGNVGVGGTFASSVDFAPGAGGLSLASAGNTDAFLWKLNADGSTAWARSYGGSDHDEANALAIDAAGNLLTTGTFTGTANFGGTSLTAGGANDAYVLKVGPTGQVVWARAFAGSFAASVGRGITLTGSGAVVSTGDFSGVTDFDPGPGLYSLTTAGSTDVYVASLDPSGALISVRSLGGTGTDYGFAVAANVSGTVAIAGKYTSPAAVGSTTLPRVGPPAIYVGELSTGPAPLAAPGAPQLEAASDTGLSAGDGITAAPQPVFDVNQAVAGALVDLLRDGTVVATRTGPGPLADPGPVPDGNHVYTAQQRQGSGAAGPASPGTTVTFLTSTPPAPGAPALLPDDDSGTKGDGLTNVSRPRLTGLAAANATIQLLNASGVVLGTTTAAADGSYTVTSTAALADGTYGLAVRAIDLAGNIGPAGPFLPLAIDTAAPPATSAPSLLAADDSGVRGDNLTNVVMPRLTGSAAANVTVQLLNSAGTVLGTTTSAGDGSYTIAPAAALADGAYALATRVIDAAGNVGPAGAPLAIRILAARPSAPAAPSLLPADDSGVVGDGLTNVATPRLTGSALASATVQLLNALGTILGTATVASDGSFTVAPSSPLADGTYALSVRSLDLAGNVGLASPALILSILTVLPPAPLGPALLPADDSAVKGDRLTNVTLPRFAGTAAPNVTIQLLNASGSLLGSTTSAGDGSYTVSPTVALADGTFNLSTRAIDRAGNVGPVGPAVSLSILTAAPAAPAAPSLLPADDSAVNGDGLTNVTSPRLVGTASSNVTIQLLDGAGVILGTAISAGDGSFTVTPSAPLADGSYSLSIRVVDRAGNIGPAGPALNLKILTIAPAAPAAPTLLPADDSGVKGDGVTNVAGPRLVGSAAANATIQLVNAAGTVLGTTTSAADGSYTVTPASALPDGPMTLSVRVLDRAGNLGAAGPAVSLTIDTVAPPVPSPIVLLSADDTGTLGDGTTTVAQPRLAGLAEAGASVQVIDASNNMIARAVAGPDGSFLATPTAPLAGGIYALRVVATDAAGNVGMASPPYTLTILAPLAPPSMPSLLPGELLNAVRTNLTTVRQPHLVGTVAPGLTVQLLAVDGTVVGTTRSAADGSYRFAFPAALPLGTSAWRIVVIDGAGDRSIPSAPLLLTILSRA